MTVVVIAGMGMGAGLWLLLSGIAPAREPLARTLARLGNPEAIAPRSDAHSLDARIGGQLRRLPAAERLVEMLRTDVRVLRQDPDEQLAKVAAYGVVGLLWAPTVAAGAWLLVGVRLPWLLPVWLSALGGVGAVALSIRHVRQQAAEARAEFSQSLSVYCDVVSMTLSAGRELHTALFDSAVQGDGWAWRELQDTLQRGFLEGQQPWESLSVLGRELGVDDLVELAATLGLADEEGTSVAETVASRAGSMRERLVAEAETRAAAITERMAIPGAMILLGFLWFIAFPAIYLVLREAG